MNTPDASDRQLATLLRESTANLEPDVAELVAGGVARGRTTRRRRRIGTTLAAAATMGALGVAVAVAPGLGDSGSADGQAVAADPGPQAKDKAPKDQAPQAEPEFDADLAVAAADVPAAIGSMLPAGEAEPVLREHPYPVVDEPHRRIAHFLFDGTLTTFIIEPASSMGTCSEQAKESELRCEVVDGLETLTYLPTTNDQVTAQSVSVWRHGYIVTVLSYNAAEGKDVAPLMDEPAISLAELTEIARSDGWFSWTLAALRKSTTPGA
jgi:hypothetical protein